MAQATFDGSAAQFVRSSRAANRTARNINSSRVAKQGGRAAARLCTQRILQCCAQAQSVISAPAQDQVAPEADTKGMTDWLNGLKWDSGGLVAVITQVPQSFVHTKSNSTVTKMRLTARLADSAAHRHRRSPYASICRQGCPERNISDRVRQLKSAVCGSHAKTCISCVWVTCKTSV